MITTDNTTLTNYNVTGLNDNTVYNISVTASNNAGSSNPTSMLIRTNSNGKSLRSLSIYVCMYKNDIKDNGFMAFSYNDCGFCLSFFNHSNLIGYA